MKINIKFELRKIHFDFIDFKNKVKRDQEKKVSEKILNYISNNIFILLKKPPKLENCGKKLLKLNKEFLYLLYDEERLLDPKAHLGDSSKIIQDKEKYFGLVKILNFHDKILNKILELIYLNKKQENFNLFKIYEQINKEYNNSKEKWEDHTTKVVGIPKSYMITEKFRKDFDRVLAIFIEENINYQNKKTMEDFNILDFAKWVSKKIKEKSSISNKQIALKQCYTKSEEKEGKIDVLSWCKGKLNLIEIQLRNLGDLNRDTLKRLRNQTIRHIKEEERILEESEDKKFICKKKGGKQ